MSWQEVRAEQPAIFRNAALGALLLVPFAAIALCWTALVFEIPVTVVLPDWLEWARGLLTVVVFWGGLMAGVFAAVLLSGPTELRREIAFRRFAAERGLSFARYGTEPPPRGIFFAEGDDAGARKNAKARQWGRAPGNDARSLFRSHFSLSGFSLSGFSRSGGWAGCEPDLQIAVAGYSGGKNDPKGPRSAFRFLQMKMPRSLPHLMIDSQRNGSLRQYLPSRQRLSLEGTSTAISRSTCRRGTSLMRSNS
ncbi:hypothetical protein [Microterricola viridarii]|uniref:hypothetical protein n=1 Tax=Microterricola viridarii TaxID=412690 RepID=UPI00101AD26F|nr:hypothetical protein [Microterricola viridarii]